MNDCALLARRRSLLLCLSPFTPSLPPFTPSSLSLAPRTSSLHANLLTHVTSKPTIVIFKYYSTYTKLNVLNKLNPLLNRPCLTSEECEIIWSDLHTAGASTLSLTINDLKGFYVKTGQIIASRQDLFPREYTEALSGLTDYLDPMSFGLVRKVVEGELCLRGERFEEVFEEFDEVPLGAASVAQVHR